MEQGYACAMGMILRSFCLLLHQAVSMDGQFANSELRKTYLYEIGVEGTCSVVAVAPTIQILLGQARKVCQIGR